MVNLNRNNCLDADQIGYIKTRFKQANKQKMFFFIAKLFFQNEESKKQK